VTGEAFFKMCGSGNDFVFLDGRTADPARWPPERIARVCARATGVGADGLVILSPGSATGAVRFLFFNSDGSRGEMCGNAALCATRLSARLGLADPSDVRLETDAGLVRGGADPSGGPRAELALPDVEVVRQAEVAAGPGEGPAGFAVVGVPHLVIPVGDLDSVDLRARGRGLRFHEAAGPAGANVNFVSSSKGGAWAMRTYERGVEAETLACGTGAVACATVLALRGEVTLPWSVRSRAGSVLTVSGDLSPGGSLRSPRLAGEARLVFEGRLGPDTR
jgi:diaminopimelate epimerase